MDDQEITTTESPLDEPVVESAEEVTESAVEAVAEAAAEDAPADDEQEQPAAESDEQVEDASDEAVSEEDASDEDVSDEDVSDEDVSDEDAADEPELDENAEVGDAEDAEEEAEPEGPPAEWFVVHGYSGYENRVKKNLEQRIESMGMHDKIFQVVVPTEEEIEIRGGERKIVERRVFPGYILVEMVLDETSWYVVRNTPGVTGFVGSGTRPTPLSAAEVDKIMKRIEAAEPTIKVSFIVGQKVRLTEGSFADFVGVVDALFPEKGRAKVLVSMFGRETPLEVDLLHLERA